MLCSLQQSNTEDEWIFNYYNLRSVWRVFQTRQHPSMEKKRGKNVQEPTIPGIGEAVAEAGGPRDPRSLDLGLKWSLGGFLGEGWLWGAHRNTCSCPGSIEGWRSWLRRRSGHEPPVIIWGVHGGSEELWSSDASACKGRWKRKSREQWLKKR